MTTLPPPSEASKPAGAGFPAQSKPSVAAAVKPPQQASTPATAAPARQAPQKPVSKPVFSSKKQESFHASAKFLFDLLDDCGENQVSDLHVHPGKGMWRLSSGQLTKYSDPETDIITEEEIVAWMKHSDNYEDLKIDDPTKLLGEKGHTTVAFDTGTWRIRGSFRRSTVGISATFRLIPAKIPTIDDVYLPEVMVEMIRRRSGLILIEGPTGSGKTTSIAALVNYLNTNFNKHIYSVEDPIEFYHEPQGATVFTMREIGIHASDYPSAVENALRSKPDVIFIGEMLNNETKKAALHAATTGHLVITTAHAGSVAEAIDSFIGGFNAEEQPQIRSRLSQSLLGVMCQSLVPTVDGKLVAAREVMLANINFQEIINEGNMHMITAQMESGEGCFSLEDSLLDLVKRNIVDADVALREAKRPDVLVQAYKRNNIAA